MMDYGFGVWGIVSTVVSSLIGGGFVGGFLTVRAQKKKANAEAKGAEATAESSELDNVEKAIKIWREMAIAMNAELVSSRSNYQTVVTQVEALRKEVHQLNSISTRMLKMLEQITHDNMEKMVCAMKEELEKNTGVHLRDEIQK